MINLREWSRLQLAPDNDGVRSTPADNPDGVNDISAGARRALPIPTGNPFLFGSDAHPTAAALTLMIVVVLASTVSAHHATWRLSALSAESLLPAINDGAQVSRLSIRGPLLVGPSFAAGVGSGQQRRSWPHLLAQAAAWRVVVSADPGAGFLNPRAGDRGPFSRLARQLALAHFQPQLIIVQGGYNDTGKPLRLEAAQTTELLNSLHRQNPQAAIGILSVFYAMSGATKQELAIDRLLLPPLTAGHVRV